ncbi:MULTISPECIES: hypothetical protein [Chelatococcus]|uniref:Uncharacterized protein n=1 Tax=Chelatococcus asaccharovorans TaxID=28210 RepID=A0A2V3U695_9HYPH|nr:MULTISPECIES: hypothetical protein [Chelatococcus]MBS7698211.1 hypothetical protein [Chelatococcus sp. YT9]MBS7704032.1 hypothetical protein [Chelatococcus asaccharovorans]MBX3559869.1 hypothetical protein [Chelatococcus sp.]PXW58197.1 hypothetical protein C7450_106374 [Chelatococcus asaccharovorans]CAH1666764.1 conserved hypothetical protein [Chelatococcus asaccharovorans]
MINKKLREFVDRALDHNSISDEDVQRLQADILADGIATRAEADALIAVDRIVNPTSRAWGDVVIALIVDYVVWGERPSGIVRGEDAHWLVVSLGAGGGPTPVALRLAHEIVREAAQVDETLLTFILRSQRGMPETVVEELDHYRRPARRTVAA